MKATGPITSCQGSRQPAVLSRRLMPALCLVLLATLVVPSPAGAQNEHDDAKPIDAPDLEFPAGLGSAPDGSVVIADLMNNKVLRLPGPDGTAETIHALGRVDMAGDATVAPDGTVYAGTSVSTTYVENGQRFNTSVAGVIALGPNDDEPRTLPFPFLGNTAVGIAVSPSGGLAVASGTDTIGLRAPEAAEPEPLVVPGVESAISVAFAPDGSLLVSDSGGEDGQAEVLRVDPQSRTVTEAGFEGLGKPVEIAVDQFGSVYLVDRHPDGNSRVLRLFSGSGTQQELSFPDVDHKTVEGAVAPPAGLAVTPRGDVYVSYPFAGQVLYRLSAEDRTENLGVYVDRGYRSLLGRPAERSGRRYHADRLLDGTTPERVARDLVRSAEGRHRIVNAAYQSVLKRSPESGGGAYWADRLTDGLGPDVLAAKLLGSGEARARYTTNRAFTRALYQLALGRDGSGDAGTQFWASQMDQGTSRFSVALALLGSAEAVTRQVRAQYQSVLGRSPSPGELASAREAWSAFGNDPLRLGADLFASSEALNA